MSPVYGDFGPYGPHARKVVFLDEPDPRLHDFQPVEGHPDHDECTFRLDGTDDTRCGQPRSAHNGDGR